jgi:hypothetical protein
MGYDIPNIGGSCVDLLIDADKRVVVSHAGLSFRLSRRQGSASEHEVGRQLRRNHLRHTIAKAWQVYPFEQGFTAA